MLEMSQWIGRKMKTVLMLMICTLVLTFQSFAWAETATATDSLDDAVVVAKVIQNNTNVQDDSPEVISTSNQTASSVKNDLADGQIRQLPSLNEPVIDQAKVLSANEKQNLEAKIRNIYNQGKAQIGVIIVPTTGAEGIFDFAMRTAEQWKLGSAKQDNGLLIAVAVNDRKIHIATGYGLEGVLPDIMVGRIIRNQITPYFKSGQYGQGIQAGVMEIERILNLDPEIAKQAADELKARQDQAIQEQEAKDRTMTTAIIILIVGIFASFIIGNRLSASVAGVTAFAAGLIYGSGILMSLVLGFGIFFLLITSLAQLIFQMFLSGGGRGGSSGGGFGGGGGYSGGGGGFGGGGASGSW